MAMSVSNGKVAVVGLGYVGLPLAVEFGKIRSVLGFDINKKRISELQTHKDVTLEVSDDELRQAVNLEFTSDPERLGECGIFIVTVPTPIDSANRPDLSPLVKASEMVGRSLKQGGLVIYESTVYPGCTEEVCVPILERESGLSFNEGFYCGYSPERINPGDKNNTITKIKKITSGSTDESATFVDELYKSIVEAGTWKAGSLKVAEAAKVIENAQRDLNIAFVNEISQILSRLGIDTVDVLEAAGSKWNFLPFRPGLVGGHCIGVDPFYLTHKAEEVGYNPQLILSGRRLNDGMAGYSAQKIVRLMIANGIDVSNSTIAVLGVTFKDNCPDIRNSKVIDLIGELKAWGLNTVVVDPWADAEEVRHEYGIDLVGMDGVVGVDSIVVAVGHSEFKTMPLESLRVRCRSGKPVLADLKAIHPRSAAEALGFTVFRL
jgi:UDP-N-acetyl-D-galactosamine dehydrogenase